MSLNVAYVDDEVGICQMFIDNFASDTIQITTYTDPRKFLVDAEILDFDLIVLDYRLPYMNGDEIAKVLGNEVPKILISGDLTINLQQTYLRTLTKPFNLSELEALLNDLASRKGAV